MDETFTAADFASAEASLGGSPSEPTAAEGESAAPVDSAAQPGEATTQPAAATDQPSTEPDDNTPGPRLKDHQRILENARTKAVEEWKQKYGWAEQVNPADVQEAVRIAQLAQRDPIAYLQEFVKELQSHATYGPQLKSLAARALAQRGQVADQEPEFMVPQADGSIAFDPQAFGQWKQWQQRQLLTQLKQEFQPVTKTIETLQAERAALEQQQQIEHFTTTTYADMATWPGMDDKANQAAVGEYLKGLNLTSNDPREVQLLANQAYRAVVLPKLHTAERRAVLTDIKQQASAGTVNPSRPTTTPPKKWDEMSTAEALRHAMSQAGS